MHDEVVTLRLVLKTAIRHAWLAHLPDLSPPYKTQGKIVHRPWFSPAEYKQLYTATREYAKNPPQPQYQWNADQLHDYVLFIDAEAAERKTFQPVRQDVPLVFQFAGEAVSHLWKVSA
jgi:hypothetical protein